VQKGFRRTTDGEIDKLCRWLDGADRTVLHFADPRYPALLRQIHSPPPVLFVRGDPDCLRRPQVAVVGSRNPSPVGKRAAADFAETLVSGGLLVTSGLAIGIDGAAHGGALDAGGQTVAVIGSGPDIIYPARHRRLTERIIGCGAVVSEFPPATKPNPWHFPRRNRLISGLSIGTLVVEASLRSGSLSTARHALEQGREVMAVPGSIHNPLARGCHYLISQGAALVENGEQLLAEMGLPLANLKPRTSPPTSVRDDSVRDAKRRRVLEKMGFEPIELDLLMQHTGLTAQELSSMLLTLEVDGYVVPRPGGRYLRIV
jgi:DNA processing protein